MKIDVYKDRKFVKSLRPEFFTFPDGQPHIRLPEGIENGSEVEITCSIRNPKELFDLRLLMDIVAQPWKYYVKLNILWLFGARMDRPIDTLQPDTFSVVCSIIKSIENSCDINLLDIHNPKAVTFKHNQILLAPFLLGVVKDFSMNTDIYFPDKGATERYAGLFSGFNILTGKKVRDSQTGKLSGFEVESGTRTHDRIIVWDDLCDAGGTFLGQFKVLKSLGYERIGLYTTHGLYTKGLEVLSDFDAIWSTNSFQYDGNEDLKLIKHK